MSAFGIREAMNSILSGCSGSLSVAVHAQESHSNKLHRGHSSSKTSNVTMDTSTSSSPSSETIVVALDASRGIAEHALKWAASNVVQPGDCLTVLAMYPRNHHSGWKMWGFPKLAGECAIVGECNGGSSRLSRYGSRSDPEEGIKESCTRLAYKLCDTKKVHVKVKVISTTTTKGVVALEAKKLHATWVVLDRHLKKEGKCCMEGSPCNVVLVSQLGFRILCLNLKQAPAGSRGLLAFEEEPALSTSSTMLGLPLTLELEQQQRRKKVIFCPAAAADNQTTSTMHLRNSQEGESSSPEVETPFTATERGSSTSSSSSSEQDALSCLMEDPGGSHVSGSTLRMLKDRHVISGTAAAAAASASNDVYVKGASFYPDSCSKTTYERRNCLDEQLICQTNSILSDAEQYMRIRQDEHSTTTITPQDISDHFSALQVEGRKLTHKKSRASHRASDNLVPIEESVELSSSKQQHVRDHLERTSSVRKAMSLPLKRSPAGSPPLCSICQHASPVFGRPPKRFTYSELQFATGGFCKANFLAEGGYGSVHRGVLQDGIPVAVKQYKLASSQGDMEFCSEVEVLSCAQHRNVVMLIGYCIEKNRRLLVYEFICNGSLDSHLYGQDRPALKWSPRHKIAVGAARGLRYLHEECRVGCIVHRDMRPNNILLTHDFEPMVGDFGLARWQPDGDLGVETRVIGTFGYLAPEYAQTGQITEKADVYSFGVVLLELVTGRKAIDISRPKGQQCLTEWARPLLEEQAHHEMINPRLENEFNQYEAFCMLYAASLCTQRDPHLRPRMSQVLRMLEGDLTISRNSSPMRSASGRLSYSPHSNTASGRSMSPSGRTSQLASFSEKSNSLSQTVSSYMSAHPIVGCNTRLSHEALKAAYRDKIVIDSGRNSFEEHSLQHVR